MKGKRFIFCSILLYVRRKYSDNCDTARQLSKEWPKARSKSAIFELSDFTVNSFRFTFQISQSRDPCCGNWISLGSPLRCFFSSAKVSPCRKVLPITRVLLDGSQCQLTSRCNCWFWKGNGKICKCRQFLVGIKGMRPIRHGNRPHLEMYYNLLDPFHSTRSIFTEYQRFNGTGWYQLTKLDNPTLVTKWMARPDNG